MDNEEGAKTLCWTLTFSQRWCCVDLDSFLVSLYVRIDGWWQANHSSTLRRPGRRALLSGSEVLTLAILAQWPRWRSERDFWRFADAHLRCYFTTLCSQSQLNRRIRAPEPGLRALQRVFAKELCEPSVIYRVLDTALIPAIVRVRACRKGLFAGQASFCRRASKTEWAYGFKVALVVDPEGVITTFGLAQAASGEKPIGEALITQDRHGAYLADKRLHGSRVGAALAGGPRDACCGYSKEQLPRAWSKEDRRWAAGKRQIIEGVIGQLKDFFGLARHRAKTLSGLLSRLVTKVTAVHLWSTDQRLSRLTAAPPGGPVGLARCTSAV